MGVRLVLTITFGCMAWAPAALALDALGFETWEDVVRQGSALAVPKAETASAPASPAVRTTMRKRSNRPQEEALFPFLRFGAGAFASLETRLGSGGMRSEVFSSFSVNLAPWRGRLEIGADFLIGDGNHLVLLPNLKCHHVRGSSFGAYTGLEASIHSGGGYEQVGGGMIFGVIIGLVENLSLEIQAAVDLVAAQESGEEEPTGGLASHVLLQPRFGAQLMARF